MSGSLEIQLSSVWKELYRLAVVNSGEITRYNVQLKLGMSISALQTLNCLKMYHDESLIECTNKDGSTISNPNNSDFDIFRLTDKGVSRGENYYDNK
jgi:hypothetical protein